MNMSEFGLPNINKKVTNNNNGVGNGEKKMAAKKLQAQYESQKYKNNAADNLKFNESISMKNVLEKIKKLDILDTGEMNPQEIEDVDGDSLNFNLFIQKFIEMKFNDTIKKGN